MVLLPCGYYRSSGSLRAYVTLVVQLSTYVSSPGRNTSARWEFSPTVPLSVLACSWAGQFWMRFRTVLSTKAHCLFPVLVATDIFLLLVSLTLIPSAPPAMLGSAPSSGLPLFLTTCWKGVSFTLGMAIDLISLLWTILCSALPPWLLLRLRYALRTTRGKLVVLRRLL